MISVYFRWSDISIVYKSDLVGVYPFLLSQGCFSVIFFKFTNRYFFFCSLAIIPISPFSFLFICSHSQCSNTVLFLLYLIISLSDSPLQITPSVCGFFNYSLSFYHCLYSKQIFYEEKHSLYTKLEKNKQTNEEKEVEKLIDYIREKMIEQ